ncbi:PRC-barrel domain containing protein [Salinigranum sp. GCM10025319]|uniref:PRC-barrel domain containing protein n=1 Tax=Salinigranum sp. GCM10025319 TaxID=3252687 RepID=UPI003611698A
MQTVQFNEDDVGKTVVNGNGNEVGIISAVEHGTAYVDPDPGITTKITAALGWDNIDDEDGYPLQEQAVATVTDDQVRLRSDL